MMLPRKAFSLILLAISVPLLSFAQNDEEMDAILPKGFNMQKFIERSAVADWLCVYDKVAWVTSDSVMAEDPKNLQQLGPEWFCYIDENGQWHAFYGNMDEKRINYNVVFHYVIDTIDYTVKRSKEEIDSSIVNPLARVVSNGAYQLFEAGLFDILRMNWYIRYNDAKQIEYYAFPAFQPDSKAPYGAELFLLYEADGNTEIKKEFILDELRYFMPDKEKEVTINYSKYETPTLGSIFYVQYYSPYFKRINISYKDGISTFYKDSTSFSWIHIPFFEEKPPEPNHKSHTKEEVEEIKKKRMK